MTKRKTPQDLFQAIDARREHLRNQPNEPSHRDTSEWLHEIGSDFGPWIRDNMTAISIIFGLPGDPSRAYDILLSEMERMIGSND